MRLSLVSVLYYFFLNYFVPYAKIHAFTTTQPKYNPLLDRVPDNHYSLPIQRKLGL